MPDVNLTASLDSSGVATGLSQLRNTVASSSSSIQGSFASMFALGGVLAMGRELIAFGSRVNDLSERFGVGTKFIQEWGNAADEGGSSMEEVAAAMNKQIIAVSKANGGNAEMLRHFAALNVTAQDLRSLSPEEVFEKIAHSSMNAEDMVAVFGRGALALVPIMRDVASGATKLGQALDDPLIKKLDEADDAMTRVGKWGKANVFGTIAKGAISAAGAVKTFVDLNRAGFALLTGDMDRAQQLAIDISDRMFGKQDVSPADRNKGDSYGARAFAMPDGKTPPEEAAAAAATSTVDRLAELRRESYLEQLTQEEKLAALQMERADAEEEAARVRADASSTTDETEAAEIEVLKADREIAKLNKEISASKEKEANEARKIREEVDKTNTAIGKAAAQAAAAATAAQNAAASQRVNDRADQLDQSPDDRRNARAQGRRSARLQRTAAAQLADEEDRRRRGAVDVVPVNGSAYQSQLPVKNDPVAAGAESSSPVSQVLASMNEIINNLKALGANR